MAGRPRNRDGGRHGGKENDLEADLLARIVESVKLAQKHQEESKRIGQEILELEQEAKDGGV